MCVPADASGERNSSTSRRVKPVVVRGGVGEPIEAACPCPPAGGVLRRRGERPVGESMRFAASVSDSRPYKSTGSLPRSSNGPDATGGPTEKHGPVSLSSLRMPDPAVVHALVPHRLGRAKRGGREP